MRVLELHYEEKNPHIEYGNQTASIKASPEGTETVQECYIQMKLEVRTTLGLIGDVGSPAQEAAPVKEAEPVTETKATAPKKKVAKKAAPKVPVIISYNAEDEGHRDHAASLLHGVCPGWDADPDKTAKAKKLARETLIGKDFMDAEGNVLTSFRELVVSGMVDKVVL